MPEHGSKTTPNEESKKLLPRNIQMKTLLTKIFLYVLIICGVAPEITACSPPPWPCVAILRAGVPVNPGFSCCMAVGCPCPKEGYFFCNGSCLLDGSESYSNITRWQFDIGNDGTVEYTDYDDGKVYHVFDTAGRIPIRLTVTNVSGRTNTTVVYVTVKLSYFVSPDGDDLYDGLYPDHTESLHGPKKTIQAAVDVAPSGSYIALSDGTYVGPGNDNISVAKELHFSHSGNREDCIISGGLFTLNADASIDNIRFENCPNGAVESYSGMLSFHNCAFVSCSNAVLVIGNPRPVQIDHCSFLGCANRAISVDTEIVFLEGENPGFLGHWTSGIGFCTFENCSGGGIYLSKRGCVFECSFENCTAARGGAICTGDEIVPDPGLPPMNCPVRIISCSIENCTASDSGGGVYGRVAISGGEIADCTAARSGGGFCGTPFEMDTVTIQRCRTTTEDIVCGEPTRNGGGGACVWGIPGYTLNIKNSKINDNYTCGSGGGGGVFFKVESNNNLDVVMKDCEIKYNAAGYSPDIRGGDGGGVAMRLYYWSIPDPALFCAVTSLDPRPKLKIQNCIISENVAMSKGGGLFLQDRKDDLNSSYLPIKTELINCMVTKNCAWDKQGGGLYLFEGQLVARDCNISMNYATGTGGGIHSEGVSGYLLNEIECTNCKIMGNTVQTKGNEENFHWLLDQWPEMEGTIPIIGGGQIEGYGAGIFAGGATLNTDLTLPDLFKTGVLKLNNCLIVGNRIGYWLPFTSAAKGGGVFTINDAYILNCSIIDNYAQSGSAVYQDHRSTIQMCNSILMNDTLPIDYDQQSNGTFWGDTDLNSYVVGGLEVWRNNVVENYDALVQPQPLPLFHIILGPYSSANSSNVPTFSTEPPFTRGYWSLSPYYHEDTWVLPDVQSSPPFWSPYHIHDSPDACACGCIDTGTTIFPPGFALDLLQCDIDKQTRINGENVDLGFDELSGELQDCSEP